MRTRLALYALAAALVAGCQSNGEHALLERELRLQEDKLYHLQAMLDDCHAMLESSRRENESLKHELSTGDRVPGAEVVPPGIRGPSASPPRSMPSRPALPPLRSRSTPELPGPMLQPPAVELPTTPGEPGPLPGPAMPAPPRDSGVDRVGPTGPVAKIVLNSRLTGGLNHDGRAGDEGILVAFEPRDAADKLVQTPGDVSVVVLDPAKQGPEARVARWDFSSDEVAVHFRKSVLERGLHFELPWPSNPPTSQRLHLFVRYTTADGQKLVAERTIDIAPPARGTNGWTRASATARIVEPSEVDSTADRVERAASTRRPDGSTLADVAEESTPDRVEKATGPESSTPPVARNAAVPVREKPAEKRPAWSPYR